jgi:N-acetylglutamate synthase-like GNAT family acetyltransferase
MDRPVFTRTFPIAAGPRVRLRLARPSDYERIARLLRERNAEAYEFGLRRLLRFDPSRRSVIAAFAPIDGVETLVGVGAIDHAPDAEVDTLVLDERLTDGLGELLVRTLEARAGSFARRVA